MRLDMETAERQQDLELVLSAIGRTSDRRLRPANGGEKQVACATLAFSTNLKPADELTKMLNLIRMDEVWVKEGVMQDICIVVDHRGLFVAYEDTAEPSKFWGVQPGKDFWDWHIDLQSPRSLSWRWHGYGLGDQIKKEWESLLHYHLSKKRDTTDVHVGETVDIRHLLGESSPSRARDAFLGPTVPRAQPSIEERVAALEQFQDRLRGIAEKVEAFLADSDRAIKDFDKAVKGAEAMLKEAAEDTGETRELPGAISMRDAQAFANLVFPDVGPVVYQPDGKAHWMIAAEGSLSAIANFNGKFQFWDDRVTEQFDPFTRDTVESEADTLLQLAVGLV